MILIPPKSTRTEPCFPNTTLFRSLGGPDQGLDQRPHRKLPEPGDLKQEREGNAREGGLGYGKGAAVDRPQDDQRHQQQRAVGPQELAPLPPWGRRLPGISLPPAEPDGRSEEHTSELPSLLRISYAVI